MKFAYPLTILPSGAIGTTDDPATIAKGVLESVLFTDVGERPLRPAYGTAKGLFERGTALALWRNDIRQKIKAAIDTELASIVDGYKITFSAANDDGIATVTVQYSVNGQQQSVVQGTQPLTV
jgi:phage baseplate assembly protein W